MSEHFGDRFKLYNLAAQSSLLPSALSGQDERKLVPRLRLGEAGMMTTRMDTFQNVLVVRQCSPAVGPPPPEKLMEHVAYELDSLAPIPLADHCKHHYLGYRPHPNLDAFVARLPQVEAIDFAMYAGVALLHWGHFILESLPRLALLRKLLTSYPDCPILMNAWANASPEKIETLLREEPYASYLQAVGVRPDRIKIIRSAVKVKRLVVVSPASVLGLQNYFSTEAIAAWHLANEALSDAAQSVHGEPSEKVYITRRSVTRSIQNRSLLNEDEVEDVFKSLGFTVFSPELAGGERAKQKMLANAKVLAGCGGSGLLNSAFAPKCRQVVVLADQRTAIINNVIHQHMHLNYCKSTDSKVYIEKTTPTNGGDGSWKASTTELKTFLESCLY